MSIGKEKKNDFINKINEAIVKLQKTLPKQLSESDIESIRKLLDEYVTYTLDSGCGMHIDLDGLIYMAVGNGKRGNVGNDSYRPKQINDHIDKSREIVESSSVLSEMDESKLRENIPYLSIFISDDFLGIANHASQYVYSTSDEYKITEDYFVKPHAQVLREYEAKNNEENGSHDEHGE